MTTNPEVKFRVPSKLVLTNDEYHRHPAVGSSSLKEVLRSPAHYKWRVDNPQEPTPAMAFGSAMHEALLEPNLFRDNMIVMPEFSGKGSREAKEKWILEQTGKRILTREQFETIRGILRSVSENKTARGLLSGGAAEESYFWQDSDTGLVCKCRPDFLRDGNTLVDVKTTSDANPKDFARAVANFKYHIQAAYYLDGVSAVIGQKFTEFVIVAVEKEPPYAVATFYLDEATIEAGRHLYKKALKILKACKVKNEYPAYPDEITTLSLPSWAWPSEE